MKKGQVKQFEKNLAKARSKDSIKAFNKLVQVVDGRPRLVGDPPLIVPINDLLPDWDTTRSTNQSTICALLSPYPRRGSSTPLGRFPIRRRRPEGGRCRQCGHSRLDCLDAGQRGGAPLFLQAKEAQASVLEPFFGKSRYANHGRRDVEGQRLMRSASDIMLCWVQTNGIDGVTRDFYIPPTLGRQGIGNRGNHEPSCPVRLRRPLRLDTRPGPPRSGDAAAIASYLGTDDISTEPWRGLQKPTPTRTSGTTRPSNRPSTPESSQPRTPDAGGPSRVDDLPTQD